MIAAHQLIDVLGKCSYRRCGVPELDMCGVEMWRGGLGSAYLLPALSAAGASSQNTLPKVSTAAKCAIGNSISLLSMLY